MKLLGVLVAAAAMLAGQARTLDIYWIDVEGGAATLIIAPSGESLLVDTGFPGNDDRDAKRIVHAGSAAGQHVDELLGVGGGHRQQQQAGGRGRHQSGFHVVFSPT